MENYHKEKDSVVVTIDSAIYSKEAVLASGYAMLGKAHVIVGKDKKTGEFLAKLTPLGKKSGSTLDELARDFNDQLVNYAMFYQESAKNDELRKVLMATALYGVQKDETRV
ncbi:MAG TPA: hypothetical protein VJC37_04355 [Planctomycetota bacterium]|nr:hypothetical protein [Planctomycetota bacterium]